MSGARPRREGERRTGLLLLLLLLALSLSLIVRLFPLPAELALALAGLPVLSKPVRALLVRRQVRHGEAEVRGHGADGPEERDRARGVDDGVDGGAVDVGGRG